jgi:hypothetical protein
MSVEGCYCAGCVGMGPCDDELATRGEQCGECALEAQHDGPCAYLCSYCQGSGRCPACGGTGGYDDVQRCTECDAGHCPYCNEGLVSDEF